LIFIEPLSFHRWRYFNFLPKRFHPGGPLQMSSKIYLLDLR